MMRLLAAASAVALFVLLLLTTPAPAVALAGLVGLLLATVAIVALWRWLATAAACVFLIGYATAVWIESMPVSIGPALGFGLGLLFLLEAVDLACRVRGATVNGGVVRSVLGRWIALGTGTFVAAMLAMALATFFAAAVPAAASPLLAAAGALGSVWVLATLVRRAG
jgi:xanthosine utilization system XapX-like protein